MPLKQKLCNMYMNGELIKTDNITEQPASLVHIITGVTLFISHVFITLYNILTYQVVLFLVKKKCV